MRTAVSRLAILMAVLGVLVAATLTQAASNDLGNGFRHHGVATPVSNHRGTVATVDGQGRNIVLVWLFDHRGGYALLLIDAETGRSEQFAMPFPPGGDCPYASILSGHNRYYTHFNSHFVEFDPVKRAFTFHQQTAPQMAMGMTEDDSGRIWSVTYPDSGVVSFDPKTRAFKDYGHLHKENWQQYQRYVAADDTGWIYFGIGNTLSHIIGLDPATGKAKPMISEDQRVQGSASVHRDNNGKVYGCPGGKESSWFEFHGGKAVTLDATPNVDKKTIVTSSQALFHRNFPDGKRIHTCDLVERVLKIEEPKTGKVRELKFDYTSEGAHIMGVAAAPDGTICGGTAFPMRFFSYDPRADKWINRAAYGQWNVVIRQNDRFLVGGYPGGFLLEWDPSLEWVATAQDNKDCNPRFLIECKPDIYRPHELMQHPDGRTVVLAGTPDYGYTGGGLLFWDRQTHEHTLIKHTDLLPEQSTMSLVPIADGKLLGGTTTSPGTGGEKRAAQAEIYIIDMKSHAIEWHEPVFPGVQSYSDLCPGSDGLIYGVADRQRFFVFDSTRRKVVHHQETTADFGMTTSHQGPRIFVTDPGGVIHMLFVKGIARIASDTFAITLLAESPVPIGAGGDCHEGRIYFASGSHLYSYKVPEPLSAAR